MGNKFIFKCQSCGREIYAYKHVTHTRRKCSSCGSYDIIPLNSQQLIENSQKFSQNLLCSIIIVDFNGLSVLRPLIASLFKQTYKHYEIIVVDNSDNRETEGYISSLGESGIKYVRNVENNYCSANNLGAQVASGDILCFMNNDAVVNPSWLEPIVSAFCDNVNIGIVGPKIVDVEGNISSAGLEMSEDYRWKDVGVTKKDNLFISRYVRAVTGTCLCISRDCFNDIGGYDERFVMYVEDVDLCFRASKNGWKVFWQSQSVIEHRGSYTSSQFSDLALKFSERNRALFVAKHFPQSIKYVLTTAYSYENRWFLDDFYELMPVLLKELQQHASSYLEDLFSGLLFLIIQDKRVFNMEQKKDLAEIQALRSKNEELTAKFNSLLLERDMLKSDYLSYKEKKDVEISEILTHRDSLLTECDNLRAQCDLLQSKYGKLEAEHVAYCQEKDSAFEEVLSRRDALQKESEGIMKSQKELIIAHDSLKTLHEDLKVSLNKTINTLRLEVDNLSARLQRKEDELQESSLAFEDYKKQVGAEMQICKEDAERLSQKSLSLSQEISNLEHYADELNVQIVQLQEEKGASDKEVYNLTCYADELNNKIKKMQDKHNRLKEICFRQRELIHFFKHSKVCMFIYNLNEYLHEGNDANT